MNEGHLQDSVNRRFLEEVDRLRSEKLFSNEGDFAQSLGLSRSTISNIRSHVQNCNFRHLDALKQCENFDYQYVVIGTRRKSSVLASEWMIKIENEIEVIKKKLSNHSEALGQELD